MDKTKAYYDTVYETACELKERIQTLIELTEDHAGVRQTMNELLVLIPEMNPRGSNG